MSQITINKTFVLKPFSRVSKDTDHIIQQSIKYRKKNSVSQPKNTSDKKKKKKRREIENVKKTKQKNNANAKRKTTIQAIAKLFMSCAITEKMKHYPGWYIQTCLYLHYGKNNF